MFTGIIEELGIVSKVSPGSASIRLTLKAQKILEDIKLGDSIAVNGICLTVISFTATEFTVDVMPETLRRTSLAGIQPGAKVNLERAMQLGGRLGGHLVSGHIDGVGEIIQLRREDNAILVTINVAPEISCYIIPKGSIAVDGISLTVMGLTGQNFTVSLIPHTAAVTVIGAKRIGDKVNIEADMIGKYVVRLLETDKNQTQSHNMSKEFLAEHGFI